MKNNKKLIVPLMLGLVSVALLTGCKENKRCNCVTTRYGYQAARGIEELGDHANCSELDSEWVAGDSTAQIITKTCIPLE